eukprot:TRINITY_DN8537_c0_g1_i1.p1 TRINITY_DN8537_c0_g1~~TRINITY_DN8537_c0_g1_i1.p1  ORF type:complete len:259 (+),score=112.71 TRINITY_DN8537_c0_g1_i1:92-778(+)
MPMKWFPLESNPDVINKYVTGLGVTNTDIQFTDVFSTDEELLQMVPAPRHAVVFLYPITEENEAWNEKRVKEAQEAGTKAPEGLFFCKQTISNACGTIGIIHALANNASKLTLKPDSFLKTFIEKPLSPEERAKYLEEDKQLDEAQGAAAQEGQTANQDISAEINLHFIAYVHHEGKLYELDGRKDIPLECGPSTPDTVLQDTAKFVSKYMALNPDDVNFTLISLSTV